MKITTKYSAHKVSGRGRITAKCGGKQLTVEYDHALSATQNRAAAAAMLANRMNLATEQTNWYASATSMGEFRPEAERTDTCEPEPAFRLGGPNAAIPYSYKVFS